MSKFLRHFGLSCMAAVVAINVNAQNAGTVSGTVKNSNTSETLTAVTVSVKGSSTGTFTSDKGTFSLPLSSKLPVTLIFSSVGFESKEVLVSTAGAKLDVVLKPAYVLGSEVVVAASRVSERILESPVTVERISAANIRNSPAASYYDLLANLKGVDVTTASLTFKSISTRGFNGSGNTRLNQLIDGMDNQAPGLNFSVGSIVGLTELDVDNIELLAGASSALYGSGGMNGTVLINSKNPFKYQGLSFQIKQGVNHVDSYQRPQAAFKDYTVRWANKVGNRFAYKFAYQYTEAQDWLANNASNYSRTVAGQQNGAAIAGYRAIDPNYDGVNVYGDETSAKLTEISDNVNANVLAGLQSKLGSTIGQGTYDNLMLAAKGLGYSAFTSAITPYGLTAYAPFLYGASRGYFNNANVSRTGFNENLVIDPTAKNVKFTGALHYKLTDDIEASLSGYSGTGNTVYTGSDRYTLKNLSMSQVKFELKAKDWYVRGYRTLENSGDSYNATIAARYFNGAWKESVPTTRTPNLGDTWYGQYMGALVNAYAAGAGYNTANAAARAYADLNRPVAEGQSITSNATFQKIVNTPISQGGAKFLDKSQLLVFEGQYNLTNLLGLDKYDADLLVGGSTKNYTLNSQGTLFADTAGTIGIRETGLYSQLSKKFFGDVMKVSVSGRYDKNANFKGLFTPRASVVFKVAQDNNIRVSYQTAYRFPTTQNQWINLKVGAGTILMGGLPQLRDYYNFSTNKVYSASSVLAGAPVEQKFEEFKPESMNSFEIGYKTLIAKKLMVDAYMYFGNYTNFISSVAVLQSKTGTLAGLGSSSTRMAYSISTNATGKVSTSGWGVSADYLLPRNFIVSGSVYSDQIGDLAAGFISYFNTPKTRANIAISNSGFLLKDRLGFSANMHYQDGFTYEGTFAVGYVSSVNTIDAAVTYKVPSIKSMIKIGGTNILNKYYNNAYGSPSIGGLYYMSFAYNIL